MLKCEMCKKFEGSVPLTYSVEYGVWLCDDCLSSVDISRGGEVIATGTVFVAWTGVDGTKRIDATISFNKESKTWEDLGYDCFEDMIDDIAKEHGSLRRYEKTMRCVDPSNYIKIHDAAHEGKKYVLADTFGKSIIRVINDDGSSTIYYADQFQVYLEEDDNDKSIDEEE